MLEMAASSPAPKSLGSGLSPSLKVDGGGFDADIGVDEVEASSACENSSAASTLVTNGKSENAALRKSAKAKAKSGSGRHKAATTTKKGRRCRGCRQASCL